MHHTCLLLPPGLPHTTLPRYTCLLVLTTTAPAQHLCRGQTWHSTYLVLRLTRFCLPVPATHYFLWTGLTWAPCFMLVSFIPYRLITQLHTVPILLAPFFYPFIMPYGSLRIGRRPPTTCHTGFNSIPLTITDLPPLYHHYRFIYLPKIAFLILLPATVVLCMNLADHCLVRSDCGPDYHHLVFPGFHFAVFNTHYPIPFSPGYLGPFSYCLLLYLSSVLDYVTSRSQP